MAQLAGKLLRRIKRPLMSKSTVYALVKQGRIPAFRVGARGKGKILVSDEDWENFLQSCHVSELKPPDEGEGESAAFSRHAR